MSLHWLRPEWLWALIPLALLLLLLKRLRANNSQWNKMLPEHLHQVLLSGGDNSAKRPLWPLALALFTGIIAAAGPALFQSDTQVFKNQQARVIAMDMSRSMYATDFKPNRLAQAKFRANDLLKLVNDGDTGLIAYAGEAYTIAPLTSDKGTLVNLLPALSPDIMPVKGSSPEEAAQLAIQLLTQSGHLSGDIVLFGDGLTPGQADKIEQLLSNTNYQLHLYTFASRDGAPVQLPNGQLLKDNRGNIVIPRLTRAPIQQLVKNADAHWLAASPSGGELNQLADKLNQLGESQISDQLSQQWQDLGPYLACLLILPMLLSFRQGRLWQYLLPLGLIAFQPTPAHAAWWQSPQGKGQQAYAQGEHDKAAELLDQAQWRAANAYRQGDYQSAAELYQSLEGANARYNQGNALLKDGDIDGAIEQYQQALTLEQDFEQAKSNLELAQALKQQSQDSQGQGESDQQDSDQQNSEQQDQQDSEQQGPDQQSPENQSSENQSSENQSSEQQSGEQGESKQDSSNPQNSQESSSDSAQDEQSSQSEQQDSGEQGEQSESAQGDQSQHSQLESAPSRSQPEQSEPQAGTQDASAASQPEQAADNDDQQAQGAAVSPGEADGNADQLPPELQKLIQQLDDDPSLLLRNKMLLEHRKRRADGRAQVQGQAW
ncbi:VWA domain-containing protein [Paraferrimonas sedimenticola]|uniref:VWFA domain-containing protein n=1 Tax=Paraferrimonas sedimenticola TaxID=375674 RepID=A0AA37RWI3_9GAMM|nr:VWA domain-containing protein [Paraferrimonas sedimenticola]GLP96600.1 hypothetical protein GCM10007895_19060 [Paraferrimonas sedimenticola]